MMHEDINLLDRKEIDAVRWDQVISMSTGIKLYATSWYLDAMTDKSWSALIVGDYLGVMPVLIKKKLGIPYVIQPFLCQQLGFYSSDPDIISAYSKEFIHILTKKYPLIDLSFSYPIGVNCKTKTNQTLDLNNPYSSLYESYHRNVKRNINHALKSGVSVSQTTDATQFIEFMMKYDNTGLVKKNVNNLFKLIRYTTENSKSIILMAESPQGLDAMGYFIIDIDRIYFLLCGSSEAGKKNKSMYAVIDNMINKMAGSNVIFDFTGSNMTNISRRNTGFNAISETYYNIMIRKWPFSIFSDDKQK